MERFPPGFPKNILFMGCQKDPKIMKQCWEASKEDGKKYHKSWK